jgi:hypothetical protein
MGDLFFLFVNSVSSLRSTFRQEVSCQESPTHHTSKTPDEKDADGVATRREIHDADSPDASNPSTNVSSVRLAAEFLDQVFGHDVEAWRVAASMVQSLRSLDVFRRACSDLLEPCWPLVRIDRLFEAERRFLDQRALELRKLTRLRDVVVSNTNLRSSNENLMITLETEANRRTSSYQTIIKTKFST